MRLQTRFFILLVLLLLVGGAVFYTYLNRQQEKYQRQLVDRLALILQLNLQRIQERVNNALLLLWSSRQGNAEETTKAEDLQRAVDSLKRHPEVEGLSYQGALEFVHVIDARGRILASTDPARRGGTIESARLREFKQLKKPAITVVLKGDHPRIYYYHPMFMFGYEDFLGGMIGALSLSDFVAFRRDIRRATVYGSVLLLVLLLSMQGVMNRQFIFRPLAKMHGTIHRLMESRDLSLRVPIRRSDEIGYLADSFNVMLDFIQSTIQDVQSASGHLKEVSAELQEYSKQLMVGSEQQLESVSTAHDVLDRVQGSTEEIATSMNALVEFTDETTAFLRQAETATDQIVDRSNDLGASIQRNTGAVQGITNVIRDVSRTAEELSASVTEAVAAVTELNFSIREVENGAREAAQLAARMVDHSQGGQSSVQNTLQSMVRIQESFQRAYEQLSVLIRHTEAIDKISLSIQNIAGQTHLLSINASILAAQAGEHGRAFAVIVNQIQGMADQTSEYTREINHLLQQIRSSSEMVEQAMKESDDAIQAGVERASQAKNALDMILSTTYQVDEYVQKIARATGEQARGSGQIQEAVNRVNDLAASLNDVLKHLGQASRDIERSSHELSAFAEDLRMTMNTQAQGSRSMFQSVARIPEMLDGIRNGLEVQRRGIHKLTSAIEDIRIISDMNKQMVQQLRSIIEATGEESEQLTRRISEFES